MVEKVITSAELVEAFGRLREIWKRLFEETPDSHACEEIGGQVREGLDVWVDGNRELARSAFAEEDVSKQVVLDQEIMDQLEALGYVQ